MRDFTHFTRSGYDDNDRIRIVTDTGSETTLTALYAAANIRIDNTQDYSGDFVSGKNSYFYDDTQIYHTNGTDNITSDDILLMVLEDYTTTLTINDFFIVDKHDVIPTTPLTFRINKKATATAETFTGHTYYNLDRVDYGDSDAGVVINLADGTGSGGYADGDRLTSIEEIRGSDYNDIITGDAHDNELWGRDGNDILSGGAGIDFLWGGSGYDIFVLGDKTQGEDHVTSFSSSDRIRIDTDTGSETTLDALYAAANIRVDNTQNYSGDFDRGSDAIGNDFNDADINDTQIYHTNGTDTTSDDILLMVLEDYRYALTIHDFLIVDKDDVIPTTPLPPSVDTTATATAETFTGHPYNFYDRVSYSGSNAGVVINLADNTASGGYAEGDRLTSIEWIVGSRYADIITGDANDNILYGYNGHDILIGGAGIDILYGERHDDIFVLGDKTQGEDHVVDFTRNSDYNDRIRIVTDTGSETTLNALYAAANIRVSRKEYSGDFFNGSNSSSRNDTHIYDTNGTDTTSDDILLMVLEDYTKPLTINDFLIVDKHDVIPTTPLPSSVDTTATATAETFTGHTYYNYDYVSYENSDAGVTINLADNTASGGYAEGDSLTSIERIRGSDYNDIITGDAHDNVLDGYDGDDILIGGAGIDILIGYYGDDIYVLGDKTQGEDHVVYLGSDDRILIVTDTGSETTLDALYAAANIRVDYTQNYSGDFNSGYNYSSTNDTQIYHINGTDDDTSDDILLMVLEDYRYALTIDDFFIVDKHDVIPTTPLPSRISKTATAVADTFTGSPYNDDDRVSYGRSDAGVVINLADNTASGGYAEGDRFTSIEEILGSDYNDIITGDAYDNFLYGGGDGDDILIGGAGNDVLHGGDGDDIFVLGDKTQGEDHVLYFGSYERIRIVTDTGSETTLNALYAAANIRVDNTQNYSGNFDSGNYNDPDINDTQIYHTNGTSDTSDDILLMVLQDFTTALTIDMFLIVDKDDVIPTIPRVTTRATATAETFTGSNFNPRYFGPDYVYYLNSDAGVVINLADNTASGGYAEGDRFTSIEDIYGSRYADIITGDAHANELRGYNGDDILSGGAGIDRLIGGYGRDIYVLGDKTQGEDHVIDFTRSSSYNSDRIRIVTDTGSEKTLTSLYAAANIRVDNTQNYSGNFGGSGYNDADTNDTQIYHTNGTDNITSDDILLMVLEDFTTALTIDMFLIVDKDDVIPSTPLFPRIHKIATAVAETFTGHPYNFYDRVSYSGSDAGVVINLADNTASGGYAEGDRLTSIENIYGSRYSDIITGDASDNHLDGYRGDDILIGGAGIDILVDWSGDNIYVLGDKTQGEDHVINFSRSNFDVNRIRIVTDTGSETTLTALYAAANIRVDNTQNYSGDFDTGWNDPDINDTQIYHTNGTDNITSDDILLMVLEDFTTALTIDMFLIVDKDDVIPSTPLFPRIYKTATAVAKTFTGHPYNFNDYVSYVNSDAGVVINLADNTASGGYAEGDRLTSIEEIWGSVYADIITGDAHDNRLYGYRGDDILIGGAGNDTLFGYDSDDILSGGAGDDRLDGDSGDDILVGGAGNDILSGSWGDDIYVLGDKTQGEDHVTDFTRSSRYRDKIRIDTDTGSEKTLTALYAAANIRVDNTQNYSGDFVRRANSSSTNDTQIYDTNGTDTTSDDTLLMVLEDFTIPLTFSDFLIVDKDDVIPTTPLPPRVTATATSAAETFTGHTYVFDEHVSYRNSDAGVVINLANNTASGGYAEGDRLTSIERIDGSDYTDIITGGAHDNRLDGWDGNDTLNGGAGDDILYGDDGADILNGGAGIDFLIGGDGDDILIGGAGDNTLYGGSGDDIYVLGDKTQGEDHVRDFSGSYDRIRIVTDTGSEKTLTSLYAAANIRVDNTQNYSGDFVSGENSSSTNDTQIYDTNGTDTTSDDILLMVLEDYTTALTIDDFAIVDRDDVIPTTPLTYRINETATATAETFTGHPYNFDDYVSYYNSDAGVVINLADGTASGGYAEGDRLTSIERIDGSYYSDILNGGAGDDILRGSEGDDILNGGAGDDILRGGVDDDILIGGAGIDILDGGNGFVYDYDIFVLGDKTQGEDHVIDFQYNVDRIRIVTDTGSETTLNALYAAANIRVDNTKNYSGDFVGRYNSSSTNDTQIYHTNGTASDTSDDILLMVLEDYTAPLNINDFLIVDKDDVIPTISRVNARATVAVETFTGSNSPYHRDYVSYQGSDAGVVINLADNTSSGGYAEGDSFTSIEWIVGSRYADIITGDAHDNVFDGGRGDDILSGGAGDDILWGDDGDDIFVLGDKTQGEDHVLDFTRSRYDGNDRIRIVTDTGSETTLTALYAAANIRVDNTQNYSGDFGSRRNSSSTNDTQIYDTNDTDTTSDDTLLMVLEDFTTDLTIDMFEIV